MVGGLVSLLTFPLHHYPGKHCLGSPKATTARSQFSCSWGFRSRPPLTHCQGQLYCFALLGCRACSPVCYSWWRAGLVLSLSLPWDQLSCLPQISRDGKWRASFPHPWHCMADEGSRVWSALFLSHPQGVRRIVSALVCCPGRK